MIRFRDIIKEIRMSRKHASLNEGMDVPPPHIQVTNSLTATNPVNITKVYIVVATVWGEARGEGEQGMQAVMNVIMNRAKGRFDQTDKIVLKPKQFSFWNGKSSPEKFALELAKKHRDEKSFQTAVKIVDSAMKGNLTDITGGASYYFNPKLAQPTWAKKLTKTKTIGNHDFYR